MKFRRILAILVTLAMLLQPFSIVSAEEEGDAAAASHSSAIAAMQSQTKDAFYTYEKVTAITSGTRYLIVSGISSDSAYILAVSEGALTVVQATMSDGKLSLSKSDAQA